MGADRLRPPGTTCRYARRDAQDPEAAGDAVPHVNPEQYPVVWQTQAFLFVDGNCNGVYDDISDSPLAPDRVIQVNTGVIADTCAVAALRGRQVIGRRDFISPVLGEATPPAYYDYRLVDSDTGLTRPYAKPLEAVEIAGDHGCRRI